MMHNLPLIITLNTLRLPIVFKSSIFNIASCILSPAFPSFTAAVRERGKNKVFALKTKAKGAKLTTIRHYHGLDKPSAVFCLKRTRFIVNVLANFA